MTTPNDGLLLMRLFEIASSERMLEARNFMIFEFFPQNEADLKVIFAEPSKRRENFHYQMVTRFWDMAAALVNRGLLDRELFYVTNNEHLAIWAKLHEFVPFLRQRVFGSGYLANLESLIEEQPDAEAEVLAHAERFRKLAARQRLTSGAAV
jgi:DNA-directed RNA polymerase subunit F